MSFLSSINPPVLFFVLGMVAALVRSNLRIPKAVTKLLSLYLLWAIGFTGGVKLAAGGLDREAFYAIGIGVGMAALTPLVLFPILRRRVGPHDAAAVAATCGSVSAVTFLTAGTVLDAAGIPYGGYMVAVMALMESPALVVSLMLLRCAERREHGAAAVHSASWGRLLHESFLNGPVLLLLGSLAIGAITGQPGFEAFKPLCRDLFQGVLVFFLLDLGLLAARKLRTFVQRGPFFVVFGIAVALMNAAIAIVLAKLAGLSVGNATLLATLAASASYIAVPAACRLAIPKADPSTYVGLALAVVFPFNVVIGIPLYLGVIRAWWG
jgi:hypothetical protein